MITSFREQGTPGLVHGNRGRAANNRIPEETQGHVLELAENESRDINNSHFTEELEEKHGLEFSNVKNVRSIFNIFRTHSACGKLDHYLTPPEYCFHAEVSHAASALLLEKVNEIAKAL